MKKRFLVILVMLMLLLTAPAASAAPALAGLFVEGNDLLYTNSSVKMVVHDAFYRTGNWSEFEWLDADLCQREAKLWRLNQTSSRYRYLEELPNPELQEFCQELGLDYAVILYINNGGTNVYQDYYRNTFTVVVETTLKVFDVKKGRYILSESGVAEGSNRSSYNGVSSSYKAYVDAVARSMDNIRVDTYGLR